jgi:hypothetical protein
MRAITLGAALALGPGAAAAQDWTASLSAGASQADGDSAPLIGSGAASLERRFERTWIGGALGVSGGETNVPEIDAAIDQVGVFASLWWGTALGAYDIVIGADYTDEQLDGSFAAGAADIAVDGEAQTVGVSVSIERTLGDARTLTPSLTLSYSQTEADFTLETATASALVARTASGLALGARVDGAAPIAARARAVGGLAFIAAENAAAQSTVRAGGQARQRQGEGAAQWGEAYVGLEVDVSEAALVSASVGSTVGREQEEAFGALSLTWRF